VKIVLDRLRLLFGKEEKTTKELSFEGLPSFIDEREKSIRRHLEEEVANRRPQISSAIDNIRELLDSFSDSDRKPSSHPKLEKITQSSLPHFVRSLQQNIDRPLPSGEADEFYYEAALLLKGCITTLRGAGKYLPMVFPEEMKALRKEISIIGRTINELTTIFTKAGEERQQLASLRNTWHALQSLITEQTERDVRVKTLISRQDAVQKERELVKQSLEELERSQDYGILEEHQTHLAHLEKEVMNLERQKEQILGVILSVYRRAARIARHQNNREREKLIEEAIDLLESAQRECEPTRYCIQKMATIIIELIQSGALSLKGQDEQRIFNAAEKTSDEVYHICRQILAADGAVEAMKKQIREMPVHATLLHLKGEEGGISHTYEKILKERAEEEEALKTLIERIASLEDQLEQQVPALFGGECSLIFTRKGEPER
jgi:hypothetical protein